MNIDIRSALDDEGSRGDVASSSESGHAGRAAADLRDAARADVLPVTSACDVEGSRGDVAGANKRVVRLIYPSSENHAHESSGHAGRYTPTELRDAARADVAVSRARSNPDHVSLRVSPPQDISVQMNNHGRVLKHVDPHDLDHARIERERLHYVDPVSAHWCSCGETYQNLQRNFSVQLNVSTLVCHVGVQADTPASVVEVPKIVTKIVTVPDIKVVEVEKPVLVPTIKPVEVPVCIPQIKEVEKVIIVEKLETVEVPVVMPDPRSVIEVPVIEKIIEKVEVPVIVPVLKYVDKPFPIKEVVIVPKEVLVEKQVVKTYPEPYEVVKTETIPGPPIFVPQIEYVEQVVYVEKYDISVKSFCKISCSVVLILSLVLAATFIMRGIMQGKFSFAPDVRVSPSACNCTNITNITHVMNPEPTIPTTSHLSPNSPPVMPSTSTRSTSAINTWTAPSSSSTTSKTQTSITSSFSSTIQTTATSSSTRSASSTSASSTGSSSSTRSVSSTSTSSTTATSSTESSSSTLSSLTLTSTTTLSISTSSTSSTLSSSTSASTTTRSVSTSSSSSTLTSSTLTSFSTTSTSTSSTTTCGDCFCPSGRDPGSCLELGAFCGHTASEGVECCPGLTCVDLTQHGLSFHCKKAESAWGAAECAAYVADSNQTCAEAMALVHRLSQAFSGH
eukprot:TRINITY_DN5246_c0_g1_i8.p1 TRINITY_DN5246_c0_g1~~TRINITY_DN5246_c0_g1_i8.p1  ORF type:complete len:676 (-),score=85.81 TRINITY_DN5246_c0_g1_i8:21-2048(-)